MSPSGLLPTVFEARRALSWTQRQLGDNLGASMRTASRWETGRASMRADEIAKLARYVYPVRPDLAEQLALYAGQTLVSLGIVAPPPPVVVESEAKPAAARVMTRNEGPPRQRNHVCAVADAGEHTPPRQSAGARCCSRCGRRTSWGWISAGPRRRARSRRPRHSRAEATARLTRLSEVLLVAHALDRGPRDFRDRTPAPSSATSSDVGPPFEITDRGRPVALLTPLRDDASPLEQLRAAGMRSSLHEGPPRTLHLHPSRHRRVARRRRRTSRTPPGA